MKAWPQSHSHRRQNQTKFDLVVLLQVACYLHQKCLCFGLLMQGNSEAPWHSAQIHLPMESQLE